MLGSICACKLCRNMFTVNMLFSVSGQHDHYWTSFKQDNTYTEHTITCNVNQQGCWSLFCCIFHQSSCLAAARAWSPFLVRLDVWCCHVGSSEVERQLVRLQQDCWSGHSSRSRSGVPALQMRDLVPHFHQHNRWQGWGWHSIRTRGSSLCSCSIGDKYM